MPLQIGTENATSGMSKAIYDEIHALLSPPLGGMAEEDMEKVRDGWKKLAYAISKGVIDHIETNMEIKGIQASGNINAAVSGSAATQNGVVFTQNNDGTGHVG